MEIVDPQNISRKSFRNTLKKLSKFILIDFKLTVRRLNHGLKIGYHVPLLSRFLPRCSRSIILVNLYFTRRDLQHIFNSSTYCKYLRLLDCKFNFQDIEITSKAKSNITLLNFRG